MKITLNQKLTLLQLTESEGRSCPTVSKSRTVWADVSEASVTAKLNALSAGLETEISAYMLRSEFSDFTHAEYGGKRYKISQTGSAQNPMFIRLLLERG